MPPPEIPSVKELIDDAPFKFTVVAVLITMSSLAPGIPAGDQLAPSSQLLVPAPPVQDLAELNASAVCPPKEKIK